MVEQRRVKKWYGWTVEPVGTPEPPKPGPKPFKPPTKVCGIDGCDRVYLARGWCSTHYRWNRDHQTDEFVARAQGPIHGTRKRYAKGCRCAACVRRESEYRAEWRLSTGRTNTSRVLGGQP